MTKKKAGMTDKKARYYGVNVKKLTCWCVMMYHYVITYLELIMSYSNNDGWGGFLDICHKQSNTKELDKFFEVFLTISEREEFAKRFNIINELLIGTKTQREIAKDLGVSIANVSRGANLLKLYPKNIKDILKID